MGITISSQTQLFGWALLLGIASGVCYDVFRVLRQAVRHSWLAVLLEDISFFALVTAVLFGFFMERCGGEVRFFVVLGLLLGWLLYFFSAGTFLTKPMLWLLLFCKKTVASVIKPLTIVKNRLKSTVYMVYNKHIHMHLHKKPAGGKPKWANKKKKKKISVPPSMR